MGGLLKCFNAKFSKKIELKAICFKYKYMNKFVEKLTKCTLKFLGIKDLGEFNMWIYKLYKFAL